MHRAFHAVPLTMTAPDGRPTNACFGFISMLLKLIEEFEPNGIICAFDAGRPQFRMDVLSQYKAQRPPTDPLLKEQFPMIRELLESMGIPIIRLQGWEGDDILGTLASRGEQEGKHMLLVTGDKDALQLASETTSIVTTKKGISDVVIYNPDAVFERYGVTPEQVPDFLGLKGDPSDNIPGVFGIGEKTAAKLLQQYGDLENVIAHADSIKGKVGENIRNNSKDAYDSRTVATISREAPLDISLDEVIFPSFDPAVVRESFGNLRLKTHLAKVLELSRAGDKTSVEHDESALSFGDAACNAMVVISPVFAGDAARSFLSDALSQHVPLGVWVDEGDDLALFGTSRDLYIATRKGVAHFQGDDFVPVLSRVLREGSVVALDSKSVLQTLVPPDTSLDVELSNEELEAVRIFDLSIAAYLLDSSRKSYDVASLLYDYLSLSLPEPSKSMSLPVYSAACVLALEMPLSEALSEDGSRPCFDSIEMPLVPVLVRMERTGVDLDVAVLADLSLSTAKTIEQITTEIYRVAGEEFNIDSPKQLGTVLFEKLKLPMKKKTKTGYSTDASVLAELASEHPLPALVVEYRELAKIKSTYIDALPRILGADGRLHTSFNQTITATGRLSSSDPNLQNIPVRTEFGKQIRTAFTPRGANEVFVSADYSQIELRLLAHLSDDTGLIEAFCSGRDFHAATASRIFGVEIDQVDAGMRSRAKAVNFGIVYGQQAFGLARSLGIGYGEAQSMIDRYFEAYPGVKEYLDRLVEEARKTGVASTIFGRKRHVVEILSHNANVRGFGERIAMNHPMQGSAADIIKLAMIEVQRRLDEKQSEARFCLQVHDELDFECGTSEAEELGSMVRDVMENVVELKVPIEVSVSIGRNWAEAK
ncbi:MAG: DNA polymerase I [Actinobacteria bacterium]|nr:DNA polymerase I [Actinomycetota bacterium]